MNKPPPLSNNLLAGLPPEHFSGLFTKGRTTALAADQMLFLSGDVGDGCYRVDEGLLKVSVVAPAGGERILAILGPGAIVGELSMISSAPRSASVAADASWCARSSRKATSRPWPALRARTSAGS